MPFWEVPNQAANNVSVLQDAVSSRPCLAVFKHASVTSEVPRGQGTRQESLLSTPNKRKQPKEETAWFRVPRWKIQLILIFI